MKRIFLSAAFLLALTFAAKSQNTQEPAKNKDSKTEKVNPDGTLSSDGKAENGSKDAGKGTRMAITEKGIPASKSKNSGKSTVDPGQGKVNKTESPAPASDKKQ